MSETFSGLQYLTHDDCRLLKERSERKAFRAGETLIQQGSQTKLVYLLVSGMVRIDGPKGGSSAFLVKSGLWAARYQRS